MGFEKLDGTLETRAEKNGRAIDSQWLIENEFKEMQYQNEQESTTSLNEQESIASSLNKTIKRVLDKPDEDTRKMIDELHNLSQGLSNEQKRDGNSQKLEELIAEAESLLSGSVEISNDTGGFIKK